MTKKIEKINEFINKNTISDYTLSTILYNNIDYFKHIRVINDLSKLKGHMITDTLCLMGRTKFFKIEKDELLYLHDFSNDYGFKITALKYNFYLSFDITTPSILNIWEELENFGVIKEEFKKKFKLTLKQHRINQLKNNIENYNNQIILLKKELKGLE